MDKKYENQELLDRVEGIAKSILDEKRSNHHRDNFFPLLINKLEFKMGVEIGVDKAGFSKHILDKTNISMYYCIDCWMDDFGSDCKPGYFNEDGNIRFNQAQEMLKDHEGRVALFKSTSMESVDKFEDESIDFCYIDGDHSLFGIFEDVHAWTPKVKIGGIISGHDFKDGPRSGINDYWGKQLDYKIKTVVENYCSKHGYKLNVVGGKIMSWWFVKNKAPEKPFTTKVR